MADKANISSVDALEEFRANLIVYVSKARPAIEEVSSEIQRTRSWIQNDQRVHWEAQLRKRNLVLEQAKQALSSARIAVFQKDATLEQMAVQRAKRAVEEAEAKLKIIKIWNRDFDAKVEPLARQLERLHTFLSHDIVQAGAYLARAITTLQAYADLTAPTLASPELPVKSPEQTDESPAAPEGAPGPASIQAGDAP
ncbi:MAG: hypothetical protein JWM16_994 [Verrucomicrobiales bacterium]|nr:hypothetical protein [Verrucomicrobiales bacterium]